MKGLYKGVKYTLSQIFVVKEEEPELEIGGPIDVKHVGHIGWDGPSGGAPSWMGQYKTGPDFASTSIGATGTGLSTRSSSQDYGESKRTQKPASATCRDIPESELAPAKRKPRRKKCKTNSCPPSSSGSTRSSRAAKPKVKFVEDNAESSNIEVA